MSVNSIKSTDGKRKEKTCVHKTSRLISIRLHNSAEKEEGSGSVAVSRSLNKINGSGPGKPEHCIQLSKSPKITSLYIWQLSRCIFNTSLSCPGCGTSFYDRELSKELGKERILFQLNHYSKQNKSNTLKLPLRQSQLI
jgi:hypothetical protein